MPKPAALMGGDGTKVWVFGASPRNWVCVRKSGPRSAGPAKLSYRRITTKQLAKTIANEVASPSQGVAIADTTHVVLDTQDEQPSHRHQKNPPLLLTGNWTGFFETVKTVAKTNTPHQQGALCILNSPLKPLNTTPPCWKDTASTWNLSSRTTQTQQSATAPSCALWTNSSPCSPTTQISRGSNKTSPTASTTPSVPSATRNANTC